MINKDNKTNFKEKIIVYFNNNIKYIIYFVIAIFLIFVFFQYYLFQKEKKLLQLSILYDEAKTSVNSSNFDESMTEIANENGIYGMFASLELIKKELDNKNFSIVYEYYLKLLKDNKSKKIYNSIVAIHAAYNLIDFISSDKIKNILTYVDPAYVVLNGYNYEILYLLAIKDGNLEKREEISNLILNDENISSELKERISKLNEFEKYQ